MIKDIFYSKKFDDKIAVIDGEKSYTFKALKEIVSAQSKFLEGKSENIIILGDNNFNFIIQFFASIFCNKNIFLFADKKMLSNFENDYYLAEEITEERIKNHKFPAIDVQKGRVYLYTSGSSKEPKCIKKSLFNLISEAQDLGTHFGLKNKNYTVASSTTMCHLFGLTFHLMTPFCNGLKIYTKSISYPENVDKDNLIFVSSPAFLSTVLKHHLDFKISPKYIISSGSKLNEKVFEYLEQKSKIIEIYGSTETGIIANKTHFNSPFEIFENVKINILDDGAEIISDYLYENSIKINDKIEIKNNQLFIKNRTDRMMKIYEKRVSAPALENKIKESEFIEDCYVFKNGEKPACICALSDKGKEFIVKNSPANLTKILKKFTSENFEIIPQKWKYIDEIPMTVSGKINKKIIEKIFDINSSLPVILERKAEQNEVRYKIFFYKNCSFFKGHFPEFKLVPGVVQLFLAKEIANAHYDLTLGQGQWKRIKFSNIIEPDRIINLRLNKDEKNVTYEYYDDEKKYSSGVFLCENVFKG